MHSLTAHRISARPEACNRAPGSAGEVPGGMQKEGYFVRAPKLCSKFFCGFFFLPWQKQQRGVIAASSQFLR